MLHRRPPADEILCSFIIIIKNRLAQYPVGWLQHYLSLYNTVTYGKQGITSMYGVRLPSSVVDTSIPITPRMVWLDCNKHTINSSSHRDCYPSQKVLHHQYLDAKQNKPSAPHPHSHDAKTTPTHFSLQSVLPVCV